VTTGEKIRNRRIALNMTMEDLGNAIGVQRSAINKYEKGLIDIKSSTLQAIANALNISPVLLLDDVEGEDVEQFVTEVPKTVEAKLLAQGVDSMPKEQREQALSIMKTIFVQYADYFKKENDDDT
jgi:transcriptional regulator with XRE-family HTH domain